MPFQDEEIQTLMHLGLTCCQAKIYLTLVRSGDSTAKTISKISKVPREKVYRVIPALQEKGLVEKIVNKPSIYKATPMKEGFSILLKHRNSVTDELNEKSIEILKNSMKKNTNRMIPENNHDFVLIPNKGTIEKKIESNIKTTQTSLDVVSTWNRAINSFIKFNDAYMKALKRGIKIRIIVEKPQKEEDVEYERKTVEVFKEYPYFEVRHVSDPVPCIVAVKDRKEVLIFTSASLRLNESPALWSNNAPLVTLAENYFKCLWTTSLEGKQNWHNTITCLAR